MGPSTMLDDAALKEFEEKTNQVASLINALKDGSIRPEDVKIPGEKSPEELQSERAAAKRRQLKAEAAEREQWWTRTEGLTGKKRSEVESLRKLELQALLQGNQTEISSTTKGEGAPAETIKITDDDGNVLFPKPKVEADVLDYSVWEKWIPDDPVSLEEMQRAKDKIEDERNKAFEESNPEFCSQFKKDEEERRKSKAAKERDAERHRQRGNKHFRQKEYSDALVCYRDALKLSPWSQAILCNLSLAWLKTERTDQALEFSERALFLQPACVKALWRHTQACLAADRLEDAVANLYYAALLEPNNEDVAELLQASRDELNEAKAERKVSQVAKLKGNKTDVAVPNPKIPIDAWSKLNELPIAQSMWGEVAAIKGSPFEPSQELALQGLLGLLREDTRPVEERAQLLVLARTSGALKQLFSLVLGEESTDAMEQLLAMCLPGSKRNKEQFSACKVLENAIERKKVRLLVALCEHNPSFHVPVAQSRRTLLCIRDQLVKNNAALKLLDTLCVSKASRSYVSAFMGAEGSDQCVLRQLKLALDDPHAREVASATIANLCQEATIREKVDGEALAKVTLGEASTKLTDASLGLLLAALINASLEANSSVRQILSKNSDYLDKLLQLVAGKRHRTTVVGERAAGLLSRVMADSSLPACKDLVTRRPGLVDMFCEILSSCMNDSEKGTMLVQNLVRGIAAALRVVNVPSMKSVIVLSKLLHSTAQSCSGLAKDDQTATNLLQCWVTLCSSAVICEQDQVSSQAIPALIKLLQMTSDGPVRKNAAICVAKLAKSNDKNMKAVRALRGMEMLLELGNRLLAH